MDTVVVDAVHNTTLQRIGDCRSDSPVAILQQRSAASPVDPTVN